MKIVVNRIRKDGEKIRDEVFMSDIAALYFDGKNTYINKKDGYSLMVDHTLSELESYLKDNQAIQKRGM